MSPHRLAAGQICRLILSGRISVFDLSLSVRLSDIRYSQAELTKLRAEGKSGEDCFGRILKDFSKLDDIQKEIRMSQLFEYCEGQNMFFQKFNPFYRRQRELAFYKSLILKDRESNLKLLEENSRLEADRSVIRFLMEKLSQRTHVMELQPHKDSTDVIAITYQINPEWCYERSNIELYRISREKKAVLPYNARMQIIEDESVVHINDFLVSPVNCGFGSILMAYLKRYAKARGKQKIAGFLSPFDLQSHKERLLHFYRKHNFQISEPDEKGWRAVCYDLYGKEGDPGSD